MGLWKVNCRKFELVVLTLLLALFSIASQAAHLPNDAPGVKKVIAKVGERPITREDIIHLIQIEKFYNSPPLSEADALYIVMQAAIAQEIAHSVGIEVTSTEIPKQYPFVDQFTPAGMEDKKVQSDTPLQEQQFHVDHGSYAQLYIVPKLIDRKLRNYYKNSSYLHRFERVDINQALQKVMSGKSFAEASKETDLLVARHELENKEVSIPASSLPLKPTDKHLPKRESLFDILDKLEPGEIYPAIYQDNDGYRVIRLISRHGIKYSIETIEALKPGFENWLKVHASKLVITVNDDTLKHELKRIYPDIDWVERL